MGVNIVIVVKYTDEFATYEADTDEEKASTIEKLFKGKEDRCSSNYALSAPIDVS